MLMTQPTPEIIELDVNEVREVARRVQARQLNEKDYAILGQLIAAYLKLLEILQLKNLSLARLRKLIFGPSTEKAENLFDDQHPQSNTDPPASEDDEQTDPNEQQDEPPKPKPTGHGRNGADAYTGAPRIQVPHEDLQAGDPCPKCQQGTVYQVKKPGLLIRIVGQAPLHATVYELEKLRCNLCGKVFTAPPPEDLGPDTYEATASSMMALLKYGTGLPFNRSQRLQGSLGIPLPASTQWDIVNAKAKIIEPAGKELIRQAAQGDVLYQDDTSIRILQFMGKRAKQAAFQEDLQQDSDKKKRTGLFTSGIVSTCEGRQIALFFTGRQHAGENLKDLLDQRAQELERPIQMCDAQSSNMPAELETILANCLAHSRRKFADVVNSFSQECRYVIEALKVVYKNDADAREQELSPEQRLQFHQQHSAPVMNELKAWLDRQFDQRLVEPNSGLGQAISYMRNHWQKLTLFLRKAGAPLDNNVCERALKKAILHRKNSLFYKTQRGADVGDLFMSLIYTCELCGADPFDYLTELERHADDLAARPESWMPWNYRATLEGINTRGATIAGPLDSPLPSDLADPAR
jgi:hypothetical protein